MKKVWFVGASRQNSNAVTQGKSLWCLEFKSIRMTLVMSNLERKKWWFERLMIISDKTKENSDFPQFRHGNVLVSSAGDMITWGSPVTEKSELLFSEFTEHEDAFWKVLWLCALQGHRKSSYFFALYSITDLCSVCSINLVAFSLLCRQRSLLSKVR